ncbi:MAG TPA: hypothetical protein DCE41_04520 [Cytophagales bacterium]|nr:hypothetical protein [Cytophagales bacterium]HAA22758.1 hypothetical protein [Cytophagales bacterium]HAP60169.1 hypothetical protein [Cytophagales bacterium]
MTESSFQHWWSKFLQGDAAAFGKLYTPFHQKLMLYCYKYLRDEAAAEDAASETLHKLYEYPQLESVRDFERWLFTCARNLCLDLLAKEKRRGEIREEIKVGSSTYNRPAAESQLVTQDYQKVVKQTLSEKEWQVWQLHLEGYDNEALATRTGQTAKTVANLKSIARQKLRNALSKGYE